MSRFLLIFLFGVFFILISLYTYKFIRYRKVEKAVLRFMTSCIILFTFTIVCFNDVFFKENISFWGNNEFFTQYKSKPLINSIVGGKSIPPLPQDDNTLEVNEIDVADKQKIEIKITAYFDNASPPRGSITNLIVTGPPKGRVTAICQYKGHGTPYIMDIGQNGQAIIPVRVENDAEPGTMVVVDISVRYEGKVYNINSVFTPNKT